jgi:cytochrome c oxidase subunit 2
LWTADDITALGNLHLPVHTKTTIRLTSDDFIYTLSLPEIGVKEMAVPEMFFFLAFETDSVGTFDLLGDQLCGYAHRSLIANLVVENRVDFEAWLNQMQSKTGIN